MRIFVVVPALNEQKRIGKVIKGLKKINLPVIIVDDGSTDDTFRVASRFKNVTVLRHKINLGKGAALKTGSIAAFNLGADAVIYMDSDGQHKVEDIENFTTKLKEEGYEVVFGSRNFGVGVPLIRYLGNKLASLLINFLFGIYVTDLICGYRALTKKAFEKMGWESAGYAVETEMVIKTGEYGLKHCEVPVQTVYYNSYKGVTILDAISILFDVLYWRLKL